MPLLLSSPLPRTLDVHLIETHQADSEGQIRSLNSDCRKMERFVRLSRSMFQVGRWDDDPSSQRGEDISSAPHFHSSRQISVHPHGNSFPFHRILFPASEFVTEESLFPRANEPRVDVPTNGKIREGWKRHVHLPLHFHRWPTFVEDSLIDSLENG